MKVVCIGNAFYENILTIGKIYEVSLCTPDGYEILNDNNEYCIYSGFNFILLTKSKMEIRNEKIDKLLDE
jgi:hypothetical protein